MFEDVNENFDKVIDGEDFNNAFIFLIICCEKA